MAPKINHPTPFSGEAVGLVFVNGVAEVDTLDDTAAAVLTAHGYRVEKSDPKPPTERELLIAEAKELKLDTKGKVDELKARIAEHKANAAKRPADTQTPPAGGEGKTDGDKGGE